MGASSYQEECENYKNSKYAPELGEEDAPYRKGSKKQKPKRSNHKHEYIPVLIHCYYKSWKTSKLEPIILKGIACSICGKIKNVYWRYDEDEVIDWQVHMPQEWDCWKDKFIPPLEREQDAVVYTKLRKMGEYINNPR